MSTSSSVSQQLIRLGGEHFQYCVILVPVDGSAVMGWLEEGLIVEKLKVGAEQILDPCSGCGHHRAACGSGRCVHTFA